VYAVWSHYVGFGGADTGDPDPSCPTCASPHTMLQVSSDGGTRWSSPRALWPSATRQDDPQIVVDAADGRTVYASFMQDNKSSQYVARSDDFGQTWRAMLVEPLQRGTDKDILAARDANVYLVYHTQQKISASVSHDGGRTWSTDNLVGTTNSQLGVSLPSGGAIDSKGNAYFAWNGANKPGQAKETKNLYVTRSTDGGRTWTTSLVDVSLAPVGTNHLFPAIAARGDGDVRIADTCGRLRRAVRRLLRAGHRRSRDHARNLGRRPQLRRARQRLV
jgi:Neuraminidase (sialidase)